MRDGEKVQVTIGESKHLGTVKDVVEHEDKKWIIVELEDGTALRIEEHRVESMEPKAKRYWIPRFSSDACSFNGMSFPRETLAAAHKLAEGFKLVEIIEVQEVARHPVLHDRSEDAPSFPPKRPEDLGLLTNKRVVHEESNS